MINLYKKLITGGLSALMVIATLNTKAGNKDRIGAAGATQLLINPWARSSGMAGANTAGAKGIESIFLNVAGLAFTKKTELNFVRTNYLSTAGIGINNIGFAQRVGETSVVGLNVVSYDFGDIGVTSVNNPEGNNNTFRPQIANFSLSYAREFSNSIFAGITAKVITEGISNASATGVAFDAGIQYVTGSMEHIRFGIALRNVGPRMKFAGDGLSAKTQLNGNEFTLAQRTEGYELPASLNIGGAYDFYLGESSDSTGTNAKSTHRITGVFNFFSNSFGKDQFQLGAEYAFKEMFMLRAGYVYEDGITSETARTNLRSGPTAGFTVALPINKNGSTADLDYAYRVTNNLGGIHSIGISLNL